MELATEVIIGLVVVGNLVLLGLGYLSWRLIFGTPRPVAPAYQPSNDHGQMNQGDWDDRRPSGVSSHTETDPLAGLFRYDSWDEGDPVGDAPRYGDTGGVR